MRRSAETVNMETISEVLENAGPFPAGRCLIGFSGGADSTMLIRMAAVLRGKRQLEPEAIHVNHGLRGAESDQDERWCREVCAELEIPFHGVRAELGGKKDEDSCRKERFRCCREVMEQTGIRDLVLGHNRDDLAETFLMRLMRGAGLEGLACMSGIDEREGFRIYRPLLRTGREEIRNVLQSEGFSWREDSSNGSGTYLRNRVRHRLIPAMNEMAEGAAGRIARTAEILYLENRMLRKTADQFLESHSCDSWLDAQALLQCPEAARRRILREWWRQHLPETDEHSLNAGQTERLMNLLNAERGKENLPGGLIAVRGRHGMYMTGIRKDPIPEIPIAPDFPREIAFGKLCLAVSASSGNPGNGIRTQEIPAGFLNGCVLRTRRSGDRIRPFGMSGTRKLQDYLTDRGIDEPMRDEIPLICRENEVLWAAGVGTGAVPKWDAGRQNIRLTWQGTMPWRLKEGE